MKVLMIAPEPFLEPRGTPISIYQRLHALSALGHQVDLITYHVGEDVSFPGLTIHRIPNIPFIKQVKIGPSWAKPFLDAFVLFRALRLLLSRRYDVIHSHEEAAFLAIFLSALFGTAHLYDMHSSLPRQLENFKFGNWWLLVKVFELLERWVLKTCDAVITIGSDLEEYVGRINPEVRRITIENYALPTHNGRWDGRILAALKERVGRDHLRPIVYAGTFEPYQGLKLLINSARLVTARFPEALFVLVGGKPQQVEVARAEVKARQLERAVIFAGTVSPEEASEYLQLAEVLVSPRDSGTSVPLKIYSYLHAGKPIVATRLSAHTQVLNDEVAILVERNEQALAEGICACLGDPEHGRRLGSRAQSLAQLKYNDCNYLAKVKAIYDALAPMTHFRDQTQAPEPREN